MIGWELIAEMVASFLGDGLKVEALSANTVTTPALQFYSLSLKYLLNFQFCIRHPCNHAGLPVYNEVQLS